MSNNRKRSFLIRDILPRDDADDSPSDVQPAPTVTSSIELTSSRSKAREELPTNTIENWAKLMHVGDVTSPDKLPWKNAASNLIFGLRSLRPFHKTLPALGSFDNRDSHTVAADPLERLRILGVRRNLHPQSLFTAPLPGTGACICGSPSCNQSANRGYLDLGE